MKDVQVVEILHDDEFLKEEILNNKKDIFEFKKYISEELDKLKNTDNLRYNKINYDVYDIVNNINSQLSKLSERYNNKMISDEKNKRLFSDRISNINVNILNKLQEDFNKLNEVCNIIKDDNNASIQEFSKSIEKELDIIDESILENQKKLQEDFDILSENISDTNKNIDEIDSILTENINSLNINIEKINEEYRKNLSKIQKSLNETIKSLTVLNESHDNNINETLQHIKLIENNHDLLREDIKNKLSEKLNSEEFENHLIDLKKEFNKQNKNIKKIKENFQNISKNIFDNLSLVNENALNSSQIQELIVSLLEQKYDQEITEKIDKLSKDNTKEIKNIKKDVNGINEDIQKFIQNSIVDIKKDIETEIKQIVNKIKEVDKKSINIEDIEQIVKDNPDLFRGPEGKIPDHQIRGNYLYWQKPDGTWGSPIKIKNTDDDSNRHPVFMGGASGIGGGAVGGSLEKYYLTKLFDVDSTGCTQQGKIISWDTTKGIFKFTYRINDLGISNTDIWSADKIIDEIGNIPLDDYQLISEKNEINGYVGLNSLKKIDAEYLPDSVIEYKGSWNALTNTPTLVDGTGNDGDFYVTSVAGTQTFGGVSIDFTIGDWIMYRGGIWKKDQNADLSGYVKYTDNTEDLDMGDYKVKFINDSEILYTYTSDELKLVYNFNNNINDTSENGWNCTINGTNITYTPDRNNIANNSIHLVDNYVGAPENFTNWLTIDSNFNDENPFNVDTHLDLTVSLFAWVYIDSTQQSTIDKILFDTFDVAGLKYSFGVKTDGAFKYLKFTYPNFFGTQSNITGTENLPTNTWIHVGVILTGRYISFYVNGEKSSSDLLSIVGLESPFVGIESYIGDPWNGRIDNFKLFNKVLNPTEIEYVYNEYVVDYEGWRLGYYDDLFKLSYKKDDDTLGYPYNNIITSNKDGYVGICSIPSSNYRLQIKDSVYITPFSEFSDVQESEHSVLDMFNGYFRTFYNYGSLNKISEFKFGCDGLSNYITSNQNSVGLHFTIKDTLPNMESIASYTIGQSISDNIFKIASNNSDLESSTGININKYNEIGFTDIPFSGMDSYLANDTITDNLYNNNFLVVLGTNKSDEIIPAAIAPNGLPWIGIGGYAWSAICNCFEYLSFSSTGTLTISASDFLIPLLPNKYYELSWDITSTNPPISETYIGTEILDSNMYLDNWTGKKYIRTNSNPGDFVLHTNTGLSSYGFKINSISLKLVDGGKITNTGDVDLIGATSKLYIENTSVSGAQVQGSLLEAWNDEELSSFLYLDSGANNFSIEYNSLDGIAKFGNNSIGGFLFTGDLSIYNGDLIFGDNRDITINSLNTTYSPNIEIGKDALSSDGTDSNSNISVGNNAVSGGRILHPSVPGLYDYFCDSIAIGSDSKAQMDNSIAIGKLADAGTGYAYSGNIAIGYEAVIDGNRSVAIGEGSKIFNKANRAISIGNNSSIGDIDALQQFTGDDSIAIGSYSMATKDNTVAIGNHAESRVLNSMAIGANAVNDEDFSEFFDNNILLGDDNTIVRMFGSTYFTMISDIDYNAGIELAMRGETYIGMWDVNENSTPYFYLQNLLSTIYMGIDAQGYFKLTNQNIGATTGLNIDASENFGIGMLPTGDAKLEVSGNVIINAQDTTDNGDNIQQNSLFLDGPVDTDKQIVFKDNGVDKWAIQGAWRNEDARFMYFYNLDSTENPLVISRNGRFGFNRPTSLVSPYVAYNGTGLNDVTASGNFEGNLTTAFRVYIDSVGGATDTFRWEYSVNAGGTGSTWTSGGTLIPCQVTPYELRQGVYITFGATTGHGADDSWSVRGFSQDPPYTMDIKPPMIHRVIVSEDAGSSFIDYTYKSATTQCSIADSFEILGDTNHYLYLGNASKWSVVNVILSQYGVGGTFKVQYLNGSDTWVDVPNAIDSTTNLSANGDIQWDNTAFVDWAKKTIDGTEGYWLRLVPVTSYSTKPELSSICRHTNTRLAVYSAHNDLRPSFQVEADGVTKMWEAERVSTVSSYRNAEYITEQRLKEALSVYQDRIAYLTNTDSGINKLLSLTAQSSFSNTYSVSQNTQTELETWIEFEDAMNYRTSIEIGDRFENYLYLQKTTANRGVTFQVDLLILDSVGTVLHTFSSAELVAPLTTNIEAYTFLITANAQHSFVAGEKMAIRVKAKRSGSPLTTQNILIWGGGTYNSQLDYPSLKVTLDRLFEHFEEDQDTLKNQWKAKGTGTDYDIELVPKGAGIVRTTSDLDVSGLITGSGDAELPAGRICSNIASADLDTFYSGGCLNGNVAIGDPNSTDLQSNYIDVFGDIYLEEDGNFDGNHTGLNRGFIDIYNTSGAYINLSDDTPYNIRSDAQYFSINEGGGQGAGTPYFAIDKVSHFTYVGHSIRTWNEAGMIWEYEYFDTYIKGNLVVGTADIITNIDLTGNLNLDYNRKLMWQDIYSITHDGNDFIFNDNIDLGDNILKASGVTLAEDELLTIGTGTLTHDGTEFVANDDVNLGANDIQATEFRMGTSAVMKFNAITNSIDFIIN